MRKHNTTARNVQNQGLLNSWKAKRVTLSANPQVKNFHFHLTYQGLSMEQTNLFSVDCKVGPWEEWSSCSVTCGEGTRERGRLNVTRHNYQTGVSCIKLKNRCKKPVFTSFALFMQFIVNPHRLHQFLQKGFPLSKTLLLSCAKIFLVFWATD